MQRQDLHTRLHWFNKKKKEKKRSVGGGEITKREEEERREEGSLVERHIDSDGREQGFIWDYLTAYTHTPANRNTHTHTQMLA